jgi:hypothetical protein
MVKRYTVYTIVKRERKDDFWLNIGVAFPHDDSKGFNVFLQALPLGDGKIVLREADAQAGEGADDRREESRQDAPRSPGRDNGNNRDERRSSSGGRR